MSKRVYSLWFIVHSIFLLSTIHYSTACYAQQNIQPSQEEKIQKVKEHYAAGKELIQQGNYAAANDEFKKAQGLLRQTQDALKTIVPEINKDGDAIELGPKDADIHYNLALLYLKTKQYQEAAACLQKVIQLNPKDKDAYYNLGVLYESYLGDKKKALDYYAQYIKYVSGKGDTPEVKQWMRQLKKEMKQ